MCIYIHIYVICPLQIQLEYHIFVDLHENKTYKVLGLLVVNMSPQQITTFRKTYPPSKRSYIPSSPPLWQF